MTRIIAATLLALTLTSCTYCITPSMCRKGVGSEWSRSAIEFRRATAKDERAAKKAIAREARNGQGQQ